MKRKKLLAGVFKKTINLVLWIITVVIAILFAFMGRSKDDNDRNYRD